MKVSVVTLTIPGREHFLERCKSYVNAQTYFNCSHTIITGDASIGYKKNLACENVSGDVIMFLDDDDLIVPDFVERAVKHMETTGCDITGLSHAYFHAPKLACWEYEYKGGQPYCIGSTMMFKRSVWQRSKFPEINEGEEIGFLTNAGKISPHNYKDGFLAFIHGSNTASQKQIKHMKNVDIEIAHRIIEKTLNK